MKITADTLDVLVNEVSDAARVLYIVAGTYDDPEDATAIILRAAANLLEKRAAGILGRVA